MIVAVGSRLGPYEILEHLGEGGMGEVWVASDTRLNRRVAIKMISTHFAADPELQHRFQHEARIISQLNHPNICTLFDVGDDYIVMELLHGETLSSRIEHGPMPLRDVIRYGVEIAEALDTAHRSGVVHRDLKPGNVMITKNGAKLLDFGLAKTAISGLTGGDESVRITREGMVVGTLQHMAPEQLEGRPADPRMDIYALGTVLYEMITGRAAFGSSVASMMLIASVMKSDPTPISDLRPDVPPALDHLVRVCLAKDPEARWQSAHDVAEQLRWLGGAGMQPVALPPPKRNRRMPIIAGIAGVVAIGGLMVLASGLARRKESLHFSIDPPEEVRLVDPNAGGGIDVSPDGRTVVFAGRDAAGVTRLYLRDLDKFATRPLAGTEGASYPFWSPKGDALAFFAQGKLKRVRAGGGVPVDIAEAPDGRGGDWSVRDEIVFTPSIASPLMRVAASGGAVTSVTALRPGEQTHRFPSLFPDGDHILYYAGSNSRTNAGVRLTSLSNPARHLLLRVPASAYAAGNNRILFVRNGLLMLQEVDLDSMTLTGEPRQVAQNVGVAGDRAYQPIAVSPSGTLVFVADPIHRMRLVMRDRTGRLLGMLGPAGDYHEPVLDPSGKKVLVAEKPAGEPVRLMEIDLEDGRARRIAADDMGVTPVVAPDNSRVLFFRNAGAGGAVAELPRGTSITRVVAQVDGALWPDSVSPDGKLVVLEGAAAGRTDADLWLLRLGDRKLQPLLASGANESHSQLSPDGRLIAYSSDELGQSEIFVQTFPPTGAKWQVSANGGDQAQWRGDGAEVFYLAPDGRMNAVAVRRDPEFVTDEPRPLFVTELTPTTVTGDRNQYLATRDGQRFLLVEPASTHRGPRMNVITNWR